MDKIDISDNPNIQKDRLPDHRNMDFGSRLRFYRRAMSMTQKKLADITNLSTVTISKYERGITMPKDVYIIVRLCTALGITPSDFLEKSFKPLQPVRMPDDDEQSAPVYSSSTEDKYIMLKEQRELPGVVKIDMADN